MPDINSSFHNVPSDIMSSARIDKDVILGTNVKIDSSVNVHGPSLIGHRVQLGRQTTIERDVQIANDTHLHAGVFVSSGVKIGSYSSIGSGITIHRQAVIGNNVHLRIFSNLYMTRFSHLYCLTNDKEKEYLLVWLMKYSDAKVLNNKEGTLVHFKFNEPVEPLMAVADPWT